MSNPKIIALFGEPATGKSTIMRKFFEDFTDDWEVWKPVQLVEGTLSEKKNTFLMGYYDDPNQKFPGTDRFSMAVQPKAVEFIENMIEMNAPSPNIVFEGDRLCTASFLHFLAEQQDLFDVHLIYVKATQKTLDDRHVARSDTQNETFLKGRRTKYENILSSFDLKPLITKVKNENEEDLNNNVTKIIGLLD